MITTTSRMSDRLFRALLDLHMCDDPTNLTPELDNEVESALDAESAARGFTDPTNGQPSWVVAFHEFKASDQEEAPPHLERTHSDRGFARYPEIPDEYGDEPVRVYESSAAGAPHLWLSVGGAPSHLTIGNARKVAEQLLHAIEHHYQGEAP